MPPRRDPECHFWLAPIGTATWGLRNDVVQAYFRGRNPNRHKRQAV